MGSYFDEHRMEEAEEVDPITQFFRHLVQTGWTEDVNIDFHRFFPEKTHPAHPDAIKELEIVKAEDVRDPRDQCLICMDTWENCEEKEKLTKMPCKHLFHSRCIHLWLEKANTCPACRCEIRSNDELYEQYKIQEKRNKQREANIEELHNSMFS